MLEAIKNKIDNKLVFQYNPRCRTSNQPLIQLNQFVTGIRSSKLLSPPASARQISLLHGLAATAPSVTRGFAKLIFLFPQLKDIVLNL